MEQRAGRVARTVVDARTADWMVDLVRNTTTSPCPGSPPPRQRLRAGYRRDAFVRSSPEPGVTAPACGELGRVKDSPSLSMLWESTDPHDALKKRFGFQSAAIAATWVADTLSATWGISVDQCDRLVISAWNAMAWITADERRLIAKWSAIPSLFGRLKDLSSVTEWLHGHDIPVAVPIATLDGRRLVEVANEARGRLRSKLPLPGNRFLVGVVPVLDGNLLDIGDHDQVAEAGRVLAAVHDALAAYTGPVDGRRRSGDDQLVHNDFRSANLLHDGARISAVLDLEEITYDKRVADLAKAAVMLGTQYRDWAPTPADVRTAFIDSYSTCFPLTLDDHRELDAKIFAVLAANGWE